MKILKQLFIIFAVLFVSHAVVEATNLFIPANILGMILLLALLFLKVIRPDDLKETADFLFKHMAFFVLPAAAGIVADFSALGSNTALFLAAVALSTVVVYALTGKVVSLLQKKEAADDRDR